MFMHLHGRTPPVCVKTPAAQRHFGVILPDDYVWLRDPNWARVLKQPSKLNPSIKNHLRLENAYTQRMLRQAKAQQKWLAGRYIDCDADSCTVPMEDGGYHYYTRTKKGYDYPIFYRKSVQGNKPREQVMLNLNKYARRHKFVALGSIEVSPNHRYLAYTLDTTGGEFYTLHVVDLKTKATILRVRNVNDSFEWDVGSKQIFYTTLDSNNRHDTLYRQSLKSGKPVPVLSVEKPGWYLFITKSISSSFFIIGTGPGGNNRLYALPTRRPHSKLQLLCGEKHGTSYQVEHANRHFYILEQGPQALEGRLRAVNDRSLHRGEAAWKTVVRHQKGRKIEEFTLVRGWLVMVLRQHGKQLLRARNLLTGVDFTHGFGDAPFNIGLGPSGNYHAADYINFNRCTIRLHLSRMTHSTKTLELCLKSQQLKELGKPQVEKSAYVAETIWATGHDGVQIPMTLFYKKGLDINGNLPVMMRAYGSYGDVYAPYQGQSSMLLADKGALVVLAHIRGGGELGNAWHQQGCLMNRINTFKDYIACAEHLIAAGYTQAGRIVGHGGSAGGTLMGAVANMRPDLFAGLVADVPLVDIVGDMLDPSMPLTVGSNWEEYGNILEDEAAFRYVLSYCPYQNVRPQAYPHILANTALCDSRVGYWEAAKWVAKLRENNTGDSVILLHTDFHASHAGGSSYKAKVHEAMVMSSFIMHCLGITC